MSSSKKKRKAYQQKLDQERRVQERKELAKRKKVGLIGGSIFLLLIAVIAGVIVSSQPGSGNPDKLVAVDEVTTMFTGLQQEGMIIGNKDAPLTLVEFADPQRPYCALFSTQTLPTLVDQYVRTGQLRIVINLLSFIGEDSQTAARAAYQAGQQGVGPQFLELFYHNQGTENSGYVTDEFLTAISQGVGITDGSVVDAAHTSDSPYDALLADNLSVWQQEGFTQTPSFMIGPTGKTAYPALGSARVDDVHAFTSEIDKQLAAIK